MAASLDVEVVARREARELLESLGTSAVVGSLHPSIDFDCRGQAVRDEADIKRDVGPDNGSAYHARGAGGERTI
jgi:hypothetical protein